MANYKDRDAWLEYFESNRRESFQKIADLEKLVLQQKNLLILVDKFLQEKRFPEPWLMKEIREVAGIL
ncbi:MAG: hypothetical protein BWY71_00094 [Planctomycetes bacterium ADurb.Bin412]|nr:MAG: hypothetical protein BWY71_00094 [Planctomycetes bacterium ADurb.Bin412]